MTGLSPAPHRREWASSAALLLIVAAPVAYGCQPPWASGFLWAAVLVLAAVHAAGCSIRGRSWGLSSPVLMLCAVLCLSWLALGTARDWFAGPQNGRVPALSVPALISAAGLFAAMLLGNAYCTSTDRLRTVCRAAAWLGAVLACFALAQSAGYDIKVLAGWDPSTSRPSGLYTNANRFAVILCCCWMCAAAVLADGMTQHASPLHPARLEQAGLAFALTAMSVALVLTFSRLTLLCMAGGLFLAACAWSLLRWRRAREHGAPLTAADGTERALMLAVPLLVAAAWITWCLLLGSHVLRNRMATLEGELTATGRLAAIKAAWPLLQEQPIWGWGLGAFESVYTSVQPAQLPGRWNHLHCDWVELAVEAGAPGAVLVLLLFVVWGRTCWRIVVADYAAHSHVLRILPAAGIVVVACCSLGDFPLREPASAALVFFLAGALAAETTDVGQSGARATVRVPWLHSAAGILLALVFLAGAWCAGRSSAAYAVSPWMGRIYCPVRSGQQIEAWRAATGVAPANPELHYRLAAATFAGARGEPAAMAAARAAVRQASSLQPYDYRFPWLEAAIAQNTGAFAEALRLQESAAGMAPSNPTVREQSGQFYLYHVVAGSVPGEPERESGLEHALEHFRAVLRVAPGREGEIIRAMENAGCLNSETAGLWPGDSDTARMRRAKFYCAAGQWDRVDRELPEAAPVESREQRWYYAIRGAMELRRGDQSAGRENWKRAISPPVGGYAADEVEGWLAEQVGVLPAVECEALAEALLPELTRHPVLAGVLAKRLLNDRRWLACDRLLEQVAERSAALSALWAELALEMGDTGSAGQRARAAWERDHANWGAWYEQFQERLRQQRK